MYTSIHVKEIGMDIYTAEVQPGAKVLYLWLKDNPGIYSQAEMGMKTGATTQSVNAYVKVLKKGGYVAMGEVEGTRRFFYEVTNITP